MVVRLGNILWRILIAGIFLIAAWGKWREGINYLPPYTIYDRLIEFSSFRHYAALLTEAGVGLWLLSGWRIRWSSVLASVILLTFTVILALELRAESPANCGCGITQVYPDGDPRIGLWMGIVRNGILMLGCLWLMVLGPDEEPTPAVTEPQDRESSARN